MAFEMICGQCRGNLLVEHFGVVVACPHCGAHLQVPAPADAPPSPATESASPSTPMEEPVAMSPSIESSPSDDSQESAPAPLTEELRVFTGDESEPPPSVEISVVQSIEVSEAVPGPSESVTEAAPVQASSETGFSLSTLLTASAADAPPAAAVAVPPAESSAADAAAADIESATAMVGESSASSADSSSVESAAAPQADAVLSGLSGLFGSSEVAPTEAAVVPSEPITIAAEVGTTAGTANLESSPTAVTVELTSSAVSEMTVVPAPPASKPASKDSITISKMLFVVLLSYASAMTLGFGWMLYQLRMGGVSGGLEALPDPAPPPKTAGFQWYGPRTVLTADHKLGVGDTQRFGNIKVTIVKVTRGPIEFRHFRDRQETRPATFPVLKLWLRFENVSSDQTIWPLDDQLLFRRYGDRFDYKSSQFVCRADQMTEKKPQIVIAYDHIVGSGWDVVGLPLDKPLAPAESREYFVPTCELGLEQLTGELVWRVQIRKGYSSRGNSVTTLFEVHFNSQDVRDEPA
jgi:hypothetical protein